MDARLLGNNTYTEKFHKELLLGKNEKEEFSIGRSEEADCCILDINISRKHAYLKFDKENNSWNIADNKSSNGVFVNGIRLKPLTPFPLSCGDLISIPSNATKYIWSYGVQNDDQQLPYNSKKHRILSDIATNEQDNPTDQVQLQMILKEREQLNEKVKEREEAIDKEKSDKEELCKMVRKSEEAIAKEKADKEELGRKVREQEEAIARGKADKEKLDRKVKETEEAVAKEKADKEELDRKVKENEEAIAKEKADKEAERLEKEKVQNELETKEKEISELKNELDLKRKLDEENSLSAKKSKTEEKARFLEKCNDELKCSICDDIFIRPISLNCGHAYCQLCFYKWKSSCKKKKQEFCCPDCRSKVTEYMFDSHLENLIYSIYIDASHDASEARETALLEREFAKCDWFSGRKH